ncbi:MAG: iron-sulfur cluster assembly scaffold protein [Chlamydiales bacterium]|nr:iron-sulfur cluster assembly scaffold protein [Chlamydiales bacterium]
MSYDDLLKTFPWARYSKKMAAKIDRPRSAGYFTEEDAVERGMRRVIGREGLMEEGNVVALYWLVDPTDGVIADVKFQIFGQSALIAAAEAACELLIGKNYDQAKRIGAELLDKQLRDKPDTPAFPEETLGHLNLVIDAIDDAVEKCLDIPLSEHYATPIPKDNACEGYPGWLDLSYEKKIAVIEAVLDEEVRPYVELDAGGIQVEKLVDDRELVIAYQGACTSCFSAIGTTLSTIQQIIQTKVHPGLVVVPNMDALKL